MEKESFIFVFDVYQVSNKFSPEENKYLSTEYKDSGDNEDKLDVILKEISKLMMI